MKERESIDGGRKKDKEINREKDAGKEIKGKERQWKRQRTTESDRESDGESQRVREEIKWKK